ncbi:MAG: DUF177 domain-containing protein [Rhodospirillales bacterium]
MTDTPELHRPVKADALPAQGRTMNIVATDDELQAIKNRLDLTALRFLEGTITLKPEMGRQISLHGAIRAEIVQNCVITGDPLTTVLDFALSRVFQEDADPFEGLNNDEDDDAITDPDIEEPDPIEDGVIDVGEQMVEELALNIPPYPRSPGASVSEIADEPGRSESAASPFAVLASLKDQMKSKD